MAYFYDQITKEFFAAPATSVGPMMKDAVTFIGYLEVSTEAVPEELHPNEQQCRDLGTPEARAIMSQLRTRCGQGEKLTYVLPPPR